MRPRDLVVIALVVACDNAVAQTTDSPAAPSTEPASAAAGTADGSAWSFGASAYTYFVPDDRDYVQPTFTADRGRLHFEARYNYEALETGSTWIGWNLSTGDSLVLAFTPIAGVAFGDTKGFAPGYRGSLAWRKLALDSEGEYLVDSDDSSNSFFYNWSELSVSPMDSFRLGIVIQRTRSYHSDRELQRGILLGGSYRATAWSAYLFNPDADKPMLVVAFALAF